MDFITSDRSLKVGDLVFSSYHKKELLFKIVDVQRRYLNQNDLRYDCYAGGSVGDEYNPIITISSVANLSIVSDPNKKFRKTTATVDAAYLIKATPKHILTHLKRLRKLIHELWP